jgi:methylenetetrahydrofolate reductase (NADPH)
MMTKALAALLSNPIYELVPIRGMEEAAAALPSHASVTVTASPRLGIGATLDAAEWLAAHGHDVSPHIAARSIHDRAHLADIVARIRNAGIRKAFIVGGDGDAVGEFRDGLTLLQALEPLGGICSSTARCSGTSCKAARSVLMRCSPGWALQSPTLGRIFARCTCSP